MIKLTAEEMSSAIQVWPFSHAPEAFRKLSGHGGDEDWIAYVPENYNCHYIHWLTKLGNDVEKCRVIVQSEDGVTLGGTVYIGAHG